MGVGLSFFAVLSSTLNPHFSHLNPCRSEDAVVGNMAYLFGGVVGTLLLCLRFKFR